MVLYAASVSACAAAFLVGAKQVGMWLGAPALVLAGWALFGHLITLDDDAPGRWSNPERSAVVWKLSLGELSVKLTLFLVIAVLLLSQV